MVGRREAFEIIGDEQKAALLSDFIGLVYTEVCEPVRSYLQRLTP